MLNEHLLSSLGICADRPLPLHAPCDIMNITCCVQGMRKSCSGARGCCAWAATFRAALCSRLPPHCSLEGFSEEHIFCVQGMKRSCLVVHACCAWAATSQAVPCCTGRKAPAAKASSAQVCSLLVQTSLQSLPYSLFMSQDDILGVARVIDACLERVYTSAGPPIGDQA